MKDGTKPTVWFPFQNRFHYQKKVDLIFDWIDLPLKKRPQLINAYAPEGSLPHASSWHQTLNTDSVSFTASS